MINECFLYRFVVGYYSVNFKNKFVVIFLKAFKILKVDIWPFFLKTIL